MKYSLIGKKRSLFRLGGYVCLIVILIILGSFIVGRFLVGPSSALYPMTVTPRLSGALQPSHAQPPEAIRSSAVLPSVGIPGSAPGISSSTDAGPSGGGKGGSSSTGQNTKASDIGPQYLVKTLNVILNVKDTRKVADNLLTWIATTDPHASSTGTDYEQVNDNLYHISLTFSVQATRYPQIYRYLRDYTVRNGGRLATFNESMQDVTSTYVDTQSRLQNLRVEQGRLQDLLSHAQALSDILSIDQRLTDVEGQIESYEAQLNTFTSQVTFYTVSVSLEPIEGAVPVPPTNNGWSVGQIFRDAFSTSLAFGQGVLGLLIWLLAFGLYIVPLAIAVWLARKWYISTRRAAIPKVAMEATGLVNE